MPLSSPIHVLLQADGSSLHVQDQKNGAKGQLMHHHATGKIDCPTAALARRVHHVLQHTKDTETLTCTCFQGKYRKNVTNEHINSIVKGAVAALGLTKNGYTKQLVSSHSLRAGGAMAMKLNGIDRDAIRKVGRWSSDTFLMYIHTQISAFSKDVASKMSNDIDFYNIAGPTLTGGNI